MRSSYRARAALALGFLALSAAVIAARYTATGEYEISVYSGTPILAWGGFVLALGIGVLLAFTGSRECRSLALSLAVLTMLSVICLPLIRNYFYLGQADSLIHVGWVIDLLEANRPPDLNLYPALHYFGAVIHQVTGVSIQRSLLLLTLLTSVMFALSVGALAGRVSNDRWSPTVGILIGLCLFPIISIRIPSLQPSPTTVALFLVPSVIWASFVFAETSQGSKKLPFVILSVSILFFHPQHAITTIGLLFVFGVSARLFSTIAGRSPETSQVRIYDKLMMSVFAFGGWYVYYLSTRRGIGGTILGAVVGVVGGLSVTSTVTPNSGATAGLARLGGSIPEIFVKVFAVTAVASAVAAVVFSQDGADTIRKQATRQQVMIVMLGLGLLPPVLFFFVFGVSIGLAQALRYVAFIFAILSVVATVGLCRGQRRLRNASSARVAKAVTGGVVLIALLASIPVIYQSPYVYQASNQVTETQMAGYEHTFESEHRGELLTTETFAYRAESALYGATTTRSGMYGTSTATATDEHSPVRHHFANQSLPAAIERKTVLLVTDYARTKTTRVHRGITFSTDDYAYLERNDQIAKVYSNGGADLYQIRPNSSSRSQADSNSSAANGQ